MLWRLTLKTQLEDWVFLPSTGHQNCFNKSPSEDSPLSQIKMVYHLQNYKHPSYLQGKTDLSRTCLT